MKNIDITTKIAAIDYLRSLDPETTIDLPGYHEPSTAASDAVEVITGENANQWAASMNRWEWSAGELAVAVLVGLPVTIAVLGGDAQNAEITSVFPDGDVHLRFDDGDEGSYALTELEL